MIAPADGPVGRIRAATVRTLGQDLRQVLVVGGPAGDEELLAVIARSRYAVALGLALAAPGPVRR